MGAGASCPSLAGVGPSPVKTRAARTFLIPSGAFLLLGAWCIGGFGIAFVTLNRRG